MIEAVTGKERDATRSQALAERVDEQVRRMLGAGTQMQHGQKLGARIDGQPQPKHLSGTAQPGAQFIQLQMREVQMEEEALVQGVCVLASASQPRRDGGLSKAEDACGSEIGSNPSASAESTIATWWEGVFSRYNGVSRRALNVVRQA